MRRLAALGFAVLALGACGDGAVVVEATPAGVAAAGQATLEAGSARVTNVTTLVAQGETVEFELTGAFDFAAGRGELSTDLGALFEALAAGVDLPAGLPEIEGELRTVFDEGQVFLCADVLQMVAPSGCLVMDNPGGDADLGAVRALGTDPVEGLRALHGAETVEEVGSEDIDGVPTRHFRGEATLASALERLDEAEAAEVREQAEQGGVDLDSPATFDVWIDAEGLVRQTRNTVSMSVQGQSFDIDSITTFSDFGTVVEIEVPTDAVPMSELEGLVGGFGG